MPFSRLDVICFFLLFHRRHTLGHGRRGLANGVCHVKVLKLFDGDLDRIICRFSSAGLGDKVGGFFEEVCLFYQSVTGEIRRNFGEATANLL